MFQRGTAGERSEHGDEVRQRLIFGVIALVLPEIAEAYELQPMTELWKPTDIGYVIDERCAALYFALSKLSEIAESGNSESYRLTATLFVGIASAQMMKSKNLSENEAGARLGEIVKRDRDLYWEELVKVGKADSASRDEKFLVLDSDIPFCLDRGKLYADGKL